MKKPVIEFENFTFQYIYATWSKLIPFSSTILSYSFSKKPTWTYLEAITEKINLGEREKDR